MGGRCQLSLCLFWPVSVSENGLRWRCRGLISPLGGNCDTLLPSEVLQVWLSFYDLKAHLHIAVLLILHQPPNTLQSSDCTHIFYVIHLKISYVLKS